MDDQFFPNKNSGPREGSGPFVDPQQLAQLVLAAQSAGQVGQSAVVAPANSASSDVGIGRLVDPQQLAQLVMAVRALQQGGPPAGAAGRPPTQAPAASVLASTDPFAAGAAAAFGNRSAGPPASTPLRPNPSKAAAIQSARRAQTTGRSAAGVGLQEQAPLQQANPPRREHLAARNLQIAEYMKQAADYLKWRDQNFRRATGGGWESPSGRLYTDEALRGLYREYNYNYIWGQHERNSERQSSSAR
jgi:hypothetical protein